MKYSQEVVDEIIRLRKTGLSSRQISAEINVSKSGVNDVLSRNNVVLNTGPNIAIIDTETSAALVYAFSRWDVNLTQNHIKEEGGKILVACYKWLGESTVHRLYMTPKQIKRGDDRKVVEKLYRVYQQADAVVMHNAKKFDHKVIQTRGVVHGLGKLPTVKVLDTLEIAKKNLKLPSNALDSVAAYFGLGRKIETTGISLWKDVQEGSVEAMERMVTYCHGDVALLEAVFLKLANLGLPGFNAALYVNDDLQRCKVCASEDVIQTGRSFKTTVGVYAEYHCHNCGARQRGKTLLNSIQKRKSLLV